MKRFCAMIFLVVMALSVVACADDYRSGIDWKEPAIVTPGDRPCQPPSDAIVLFDGTNLDAWVGGAWDVADGEITVVPGTGDIYSKEKFGSCQIHLEFATPPAEGDGQGRGNSGLFLMNKYEVQILDSYDNPTYFDGQCGSIYKQMPPFVNACKAPGEWQTYDIYFNRPILRIEEDKVVEVIRPGYVTLVHNGVLVLNHYEILGESFWHTYPHYTVIGEKESFHLQDHNNRMKFRNIWVREIPDSNVRPVPSRMPYFADHVTE